MTTEQWCPIPGFSGYEVSDLGRIASWHRIAPNHRPRTSPRILAPRTVRDGYLKVALLDESSRQRHRWVHQLVCEAFHGPRPLGQEVRHLNGRHQDNRADNLCWGSHRDNMRDLILHGRHGQESKSHCPAGHRYDEANTYVAPSQPTARHCRACRRDRAQARRQVTAA